MAREWPDHNGTRGCHGITAHVPIISPGIQFEWRDEYCSQESHECCPTVGRYVICPKQNWRIFKASSILVYPKVKRVPQYSQTLCYILRRHLWQLFGFPYVELHKVLWMFYSHPKQIPRSECKWIATDGHMQVRVKSLLACQTQVRCRQGSVSFT